MLTPVSKQQVPSTRQIQSWSSSRTHCVCTACPHCEWHQAGYTQPI